VRAHLAHFADLVGSRIEMHGPRLRLNAASAQAIGRALHELATNAGKYGALSTNKGRVDIWWQAAANMFTMSWTENEGPPVCPCCAQVPRAPVRSPPGRSTATLDPSEHNKSQPCRFRNNFNGQPALHGLLRTLGKSARCRPMLSPALKGRPRCFRELFTAFNILLI
jgi:hypothetical protein